MSSLNGAVAPDTGAFALRIFLRLHGVDTSRVAQIAPKSAMRLDDLVAGARAFGLHPREVRSDWARLQQTRLPGIAVLRDGGFLLLGKIAETHVVVVRPSEQEPKAELLSRESFERDWTGALLLSGEAEQAPRQGGEAPRQGGEAPRWSERGKAHLRAFAESAKNFVQAVRASPEQGT